MTWVKLDDTFPDHPKVIAAGPDAAWLYVCALCYASKHLTDGFIPKDAIPRLTNLRHSDRLAQRLVDVEMFEAGEKGWWIHNYEKKQRSKDDVERERALATARSQRYRSRVHHGVTNGVSNGVGDALATDLEESRTEQTPLVPLDLATPQQRRDEPPEPPRDPAALAQVRAQFASGDVE